MPVLHVVDAIGSNLKATEINKVALLATKSADRKQLLPRAAGRAFRTGCSCAGTRGNGVGQLYYFWGTEKGNRNPRVAKEITENLGGARAEGGRSKCACLYGFSTVAGERGEGWWWNGNPGD